MGSLLILSRDLLSVLFQKCNLVTLSRLQSTCKTWKSYCLLNDTILRELKSFLDSHSEVITFAYRYLMGIEKSEKIKTLTVPIVKQLYRMVVHYYVTKDLWNLKVDTSIIRRIFANVMELSSRSSLPCKVELIEGIHKFRVTLECSTIGPFGTLCYEIEVPLKYPFIPPTVTCITPIFHPGYDKRGRMCLDILRGAWSPQLSLENVMMSIWSLLVFPCGVQECVQYAANEEAAVLFKEDKDLFFSKALKVRRRKKKLKTI